MREAELNRRAALVEAAHALIAGPSAGPRHPAGLEMLHALDPDDLLRALLLLDARKGLTAGQLAVKHGVSRRQAKSAVARFRRECRYPTAPANPNPATVSGHG